MLKTMQKIAAKICRTCRMFISLTFHSLNLFYHETNYIGYYCYCFSYAISL